MKRIQVSPEFANKIGNNQEIIDRVICMANAINELPSNMAKDVIFQMLTSYTFAGKNMDQNELELCLWELCKIRSQKKDGFEVMLSDHEQHKQYANYLEVYNMISKNDVDMCLIVSSFMDPITNKDTVCMVNLAKVLGEIEDNYDIIKNWEKALEYLCYQCTSRKEYIDSIIADNEKLIVACAKLFFWMATL